MAFTKFVQTPDYKNDQHTYKIELYIDDANPPTLRTMETSGDFKITRGNSSPEHKYEPILNTYVDIQFIDKDGFLQGILESKQDHQLKCVILEDTVDFFSGFITANRLKRKFLNELEIISFRVYDGFNYLKSFTDFTLLPQGKQSISTLFNTLVNKLNLNRNLVISIQTYPATSTTPIRPADFIGFDVAEYVLIKTDATYYDLLVDLLKSLTCQLVSENNEFWIRQIPTYIAGTLYHQRMFPNGSSFYFNSSSTFSSLNNHLANDPKKFSINSIDRITFKHPIKKDDATKFIKRKKYLTWLNPLFTNGSLGWTFSGNVWARNNSIQMLTGSSAYQASSEIQTGEAIEFKISSTVIQWLDSVMDNIYDIPLFRVTAIETGSNPNETYYYIFDDREVNGQKWNGAIEYGKVSLEIEIPKFPGALLKSSGLPGYYKKTLEVSISTTMPTFSNGKGRILFELFGGPGWLYSKPKNLCQHNFAILRYKDSVEEENESFPNDEIFTCFISGFKNTREIETVFSDNDPYVPLSFFDMNNHYSEYDGNTYYEKTDVWTPNNLSLLQNVAQFIIDSDAKNLSGYDVTFNTYQNNKPSFVNRVSANYEGLGSKTYLPVYEERFLLGNTCRMLLIEHERKSLTREYYSEYIFSNQ